MTRNSMRRSGGRGGRNRAYGHVVEVPTAAALLVGSAVAGNERTRAGVVRVIAREVDPLLHAYNRFINTDV